MSLTSQPSSRPSGGHLPLDDPEVTELPDEYRISRLQSGDVLEGLRDLRYSVQVTQDERNVGTRDS